MTNEKKIITGKLVSGRTDGLAHETTTERGARLQTSASSTVRAMGLSYRVRRRQRRCSACTVDGGAAVAAAAVGGTGTPANHDALPLPTAAGR